MIFSLFKKSRPEDKIPEARMVKAPQATPPTPGTPAAPGASQAPQSVPPGPTSATPTAPRDPSSLDFTDLSLGDLEGGGIQLENEGDPLESVVEQAAVLYAHGQEQVAKATLEDAVSRYRSGPTAERLWMMLFDYYQIKGEKEGFEALELDFARTFERSPPAWCGTKQAEATAIGGGNPTAVFKGDMEGSNNAAFGILADALEKGSRACLDLSKVQALDNAGAARFLKLLQQMDKRKKAVELIGTAGLEAKLGDVIAPGRQENPDCWLLLLELMQRTGRQEEFDEKAVDYAVTFEVSPPSWDPARVQAMPDGATAVCAVVIDADAGNAYCLQGDVKNARFTDLKDFAASHDPVVIDCSQTSRIDFVSAGALINLLTPVKRQGKMVTVRSANRLVAELLKVVGVDAVARIEPARK